MSSSHDRIDLPLAGNASFGFSEGKDSEGKDVVTLSQSIQLASSGGASGPTSVGGGTTSPMPPIRGRNVQTFEPAWPVNVTDGSDAVFWGVFVDEPVFEGEPPTLKERALRADTAWLFTIRMADEKKP